MAIVGAPMDDLVSDRPGARFAPRAIRAASCPPGPHLEAKVDALEVLRVVDFGDAPVIPADPGISHAAIESTVGAVLAAGAVPVTLGGDHSITKPCVQAVAAAHGPVGVIHFDTHTDTGAEVFGVERSHGTFMKQLVDDGHVAGARYAQIGLRGYWPGPVEFGWQAERGITSLFAHDVRDLGIREVVARAIAAVGEGPVYLTVDVDVLDPAFIPGGTGTPEPGGMTASELLLAVRLVAAELRAGRRRRRRGHPDRRRLGRQRRVGRRARGARSADRYRAPANSTRIEGKHGRGGVTFRSHTWSRFRPIGERT